MKVKDSPSCRHKRRHEELCAAVDERVRRFEALFTQTFETILAYALRRADPELAEDAVAETFATAWRRLDDVPPEPLPWLFGVTRRILSNQRRSRSRRQALASRVTNEVRGSLAESRDPADVVSEREYMRTALRALSQGDREVLMLVAWEGLSSNQAAAALGCTPQAFMVRLHRARKRLAMSLDRLEVKERAASVPVPESAEGEPR
jgi:RNA polymerase sigma factor (sigma-70 family)